MYTYTSYRDAYGQLTNNEETPSVDLGMGWINDATREVCIRNGGKWWFLEGQLTIPTVDGQQSYILPQIVRKITDIYIQVGNNFYTPVMLETEKAWARVLQSQLGEGDRTLFAYRRGSRLYIAPTPGADSNSILVTYRKNIVDLTTADYTDGTVSATDGDETIAGVGTTFTAPMVGRYLRATSGDKQWYEIGSFTSTTSIELLQPYEGVDVAGSDYIIGEVNVLPEVYQKIPLYMAVSQYWLMNGDSTRSQLYDNKAEALYQSMVQEAGEKFEQAYMAPIDNYMFRDPNIPEPDVPTSSFS